MSASMIVVYVFQDKVNNNAPLFRTTWSKLAQAKAQCKTDFDTALKLVGKAASPFTQYTPKNWDMKVVNLSAKCTLLLTDNTGIMLIFSVKLRSLCCRNGFLSYPQG